MNFNNGYINMGYREFEKFATSYAWIGLIWIVIINLFSIIRNPSFIIFSIIAIALGTLGIWIDFFPDGIHEGATLTQSVNKLSVFTFCIATLGGLVTDYVFEEKYLDITVGNGQQLLTRHL